MQDFPGESRNELGPDVIATAFKDSFGTTQAPPAGYELSTLIEDVDGQTHVIASEHLESIEPHPETRAHFVLRLAKGVITHHPAKRGHTQVWLTGGAITCTGAAVLAARALIGHRRKAKK